MSIGESLRANRKTKGLTQAELAERAGISRSYYADIEKDYYNPSLETLKSIASALGVAPSALLGDDVDFLTITAVDNDMEAAYNTIVQAKQHAKIEPTTISNDEERLLDLYRELNDEGQEKLIEHADDMVQSRKYIKSDPALLVERKA